MAIEDELRERLSEGRGSVFRRRPTAGEPSNAAGAAAERLAEPARRLPAERRNADRTAETARRMRLELKFTMPDLWSTRLFIALCRRYGFNPFRYTRQRSTTIMVKAPRRLFEEVVRAPVQRRACGPVGLSRPDDGAPDPGDDPRRRRRAPRPRPNRSR